MWPGRLLILLAILAVASFGEAPRRVTAFDPSTTPVPTSPFNGTVIPKLGVTVSWRLPDTQATQFHLQVIPAFNDGPGINLVRNTNGTTNGWFTIPEPPTWYVLLPDTTYFWRVRVTGTPTLIPENDPSWAPFSPYTTFRTPKVSSTGIAAVSPGNGLQVGNSGPATLQWSHPDRAIFYWEVQVSGDDRFNDDPFTGTSFVWWNFVHGGIVNPQNSWVTPALEPHRTYYWRVRPRIQSDGQPMFWSETFSFATP